METYNIREKNKTEILTLINKHKQISRKEIAEILNMTTMTVSNIIKFFLSEGICQEIGKDLTKKNIGRKTQLIEINYEYKKTIGLSIRKIQNKWEITLVLSNLNFFIFEEEMLLVDDNVSIVNLISNIKEKIKLFLNKYKLINDDILGMGISFTGVVNSKTGVIISSPTGVSNFNLLENFNEFDFPTYVVNNTLGYAVGELIFGSKNLTNYIYLRYAEGLSSAMIYKKNLFNETNIFAGKIGHMTIASSKNNICHCGNINCLETFVHFSTLREKFNNKYSSIEIINLYKNNSNITKILNEALDLIIVNLINLCRFTGIYKVILDGILFQNENILDYIKSQSPANLIYTPKTSKNSKPAGAIAYLLIKEFYKNKNI